MKKGFAILFVILSALFSAKSYGNINIVSVKEELKIGYPFSESTAVITLEVEGLSEGAYYTSWGFTTSQETKWEDVKVIRGPEVSHIDKTSHSIKLRFSSGLFNGDKMIVLLKTKIKVHIAGPDSYVVFPSFAGFDGGQKYELTVSTPDNFVIHSSHDQDDWTDVNDTFVPDGGTYKGNKPFKSPIEFTSKKRTWKVEIVNPLKVWGSGKLTAKFPSALKGTERAKMVKYRQIISPKPSKQEKKGLRITAVWNHLSSDVKIGWEAVVKVRAGFFLPNDTPVKTKFRSKRAKKFLKLSRDDIATVKSLLPYLPVRKVKTAEDIKKILRWVHSFITYDYSYTGAQMKLSELVRVRRGVCEHYSQLFEAIMRYMGVPSSVVNGFSHDPNGRMGRHAWVAVYIDAKQKWFELDPTWDIMSGILPTSHIPTGLGLGRDNGISIKYSGRMNVYFENDIFSISPLD